LPPAPMAAQQRGLRPPSQQIEQAKTPREMSARDENPRLL